VVLHVLRYENDPASMAPARDAARISGWITNQGHGSGAAHRGPEYRTPATYHHVLCCARLTILELLEDASVKTRLLDRFGLVLAVYQAENELRFFYVVGVIAHRLGKASFLRRDGFFAFFGNI
jgi:hypothetical protein